MKKIIVPILVGFFTYLFLLLAINSDYVTENITIGIITTIGLSSVLYIIIFGYIKDKENFNIGFLGFMVGRIFIGIGLPILLIIYKLYFTENNENIPDSILEKKKISLISNKEECAEIRYGTFVIGYDTIIRFKKDENDFEIFKSLGSKKEYLIKWIDSCTYLRINPENNSVSDILKIGNFEDSNHFLYCKPAITHKIDDERIYFVRTIKNYH